MSYVLQDLMMRDLSPSDITRVTGLVSGVMADGPVARWLCPDAEVRRQTAHGYFEVMIEHAVAHGEVYGTEDHDTGDLTSVAVWLPLTGPIVSAGDYEQRMKEAAGSAFDRARELDAAREARHPLDAHHYLAFLAVRPDVQEHGIGSALLDCHHVKLDRAGLPAYLEAADLRSRDLYLRHGYQVRSVIALPDGPTLWTMWRSPMP